MNTKIISALVIIAAMATVIPAFMVPANAQFSAFNTNNNASQTSTQSNTATATGGAGGTGIFGSANGGSASVDQENTATQQAAQSGAFGTSSNTNSGD
jgi:uncharacterized membrane protein